MWATIGLYPSAPWYSNFSDAPFTSLKISEIPKLIAEKLLGPKLIEVEKLNDILSHNPRKILGMKKSTNKIILNKDSDKIGRNQ